MDREEQKEKRLRKAANRIKRYEELRDKGYHPLRGPGWRETSKHEEELKEEGYAPDWWIETCDLPEVPASRLRKELTRERTARRRKRRGQR